MATLEQLLADDLERQGRGWARAVADGIRAELPGLFDDARSAELALLGIDALLREFVSVLRSGLGGGVRAPHAAVAFAQHLARRDTPLADVLRSYRIGQEASFARAAQLAMTAEDPDQVVAITRVGILSFQFTDAVMSDIAAAFEEQRERLIHQSAARREAVVAQLLAGERVAGAETTLGYRLDRDHIAIVGVDGTDPAGAVRALGAGPALLTSLAAWIPATALDWRRLEGTGLRVAAGNPGTFGGTYRQASRAASIADLTDRPVIRYADVALTALLLDDRAAAHRFADEELGDLAGDRGLRETLLAYFDAGQDRSATAAALGVHRNTVSRRIAKAEELLGHALNKRRRELEAALLIAG